MEGKAAERGKAAFLSFARNPTRRRAGFEEKEPRYARPFTIAENFVCDAIGTTTAGIQSPPLNSAGKARTPCMSLVYAES